MKYLVLCAPVALATSMFLAVGATRAVASPVIPVSPFSGNFSESWEGFTNGPLPMTVDIMGGAASITNSRPVPNMSVYHIGVDPYGLDAGGTAGVHDGSQGMGTEDFPDPYMTTITFDSPVSQFGAYWAVSTAGAPPPAFVSVNLFFYDADDNQLDGPVSFNYLLSNNGALVWNGWAAAPGEAFAKIEYVGSGIAIDALQATAETPEPATLLTFLAGTATMIGYGVSRRIRRRLPSAL
jgi:hypothetical protein